MVKVIKEVKKQSPTSFGQAIALNQSIIESTADGILVIDLHGKVVTYNKKFLELWGIPGSLVSTRDDKKLLNYVLDQLEDPKAFTEKVNELYNYPEITSFDTLKFKDGRVFDRYSQPQMIGEEIVGRVWSFRGVSKQKELEESLRKSKERFKLSLDAVEEGVWDWNLVTNEIYFSPRWEALYGYKPGEVEPHFRTLEKIVYPEDEKLVMQAFKDHAEGRTDSYNVEHRVKTKSGGWVWTLGRGKIVERDRQGKPLRMVGTARDITERKRAEEMLLESNEILERIFETTHFHVILLDSKCNFIRVNKAYAKTYRYEPDYFIGKNHFDLYPSEELESKFRSVLETGNPYTAYSRPFEFSDQPERGITYWDLAVYPVKKQSGEVEGLLFTLLEVTERKKMEEQIKTSLTEKELLLREIHHRVKNNMQVISSLLLLQSGYIKDEKVFEMLRESQNRIKSMSMIHEKLYQSKSLAKINLMDYIKDLANDMFRSYSINTNNISLRLSDEPIYFGIDNAVPLGLVINELLSNCLKHAFPEGRKGEIRITLRYISDSRFQISELKPQSTICNQNSEIELIFSDNGIGLPDKIDYRNCKSLGMQLIKGLAEDQLGGKIELNRDKGTEFKVIFKDLKEKKRI